jgi:hypothetical protein
MSSINVQYVPHALKIDIKISASGIESGRLFGQTLKIRQRCVLEQSIAVRQDDIRALLGDNSLVDGSSLIGPCKSRRIAAVQNCCGGVNMTCLADLKSRLTLSRSANHDVLARRIR